MLKATTKTSGLQRKLETLAAWLLRFGDWGRIKMPDRTTTKPDTSPAAITLVKALSLLDRKGWTQNAFQYQGRVCLLQALTEANGPGQQEATRIVNGCIPPGNIIPWNDTPGRRFEEVRTVLLAATNIARELAEG